MLRRRIETFVSLALILLAMPAAAIDWRRGKQMNLGQQETAVYNLIDTTLGGNRGREYQVNRGAIQRCLEQNVINIANDFDDTCSDGGRAGMQALHTLFTNYIWTCVN